MPDSRRSHARRHRRHHRRPPRRARALSRAPSRAVAAAARVDVASRVRGRFRRRVAPRAFSAVDPIAATYVPTPIDPAVLRDELVVLGAIAATTAYWWLVLVPSARVALAKNKKSGKLRAYLDDLARSDGKGLEKWFYAQWLAKIDPETRYLLRDDAPAAARRVETLEDVARAARRAPKFWSGDNPVLVGTALTIGLAALFSGVAP